MEGLDELALIAEIGIAFAGFLSIFLVFASRDGLGNSTGDRQMLEYTKAGDGSRLGMLVLHDDAKREYAYGPALGRVRTS